MSKLIFKSKDIRIFTKYRNCVKLTIFLLQYSLSIGRRSTFYTVKNVLNLTQLYSTIHSNDRIHILFTDARERRRAPRAEVRRVTAESAERQCDIDRAATRCSVDTFARCGRGASRRRRRRQSVRLCFGLLTRISWSGVWKWRRWVATSASASSSSRRRVRRRSTFIASLTTCWRSGDP